MCGIAGIVHTAGKPSDPRLLSAMSDTLAHRGPDDSGMFVSPRGDVALAHRRLAVIDLSAAGRQPMCNEDETVWIVFNGEIFNFQELRHQLILSGHSFRSRCDTEVVLHLYEEQGTRCLHQLNGQFAFVIWDARRRRVFGARDRLGIRPLYYVWDGEQLTFASEIKAVLQAAAKGTIDPGALVDFLVLQYVPAPRTIFTNIRKLEAGTCFELSDGQLTVNRYWSPEPRRDPLQSEDDALAALDDLLASSVRRQMIADVPIGVFLSGGIDSSSITYYMSRASAGSGIKAYSVGFDERDHDERAYAQLAAAAVPGVEHHVVVFEAADAPSVIQQLVRTLDEPLADPAIVPTFVMARRARESVTVCLAGEGADELFGGYDRYLAPIERVRCFHELTRFAPDLRPYLEGSVTLRYEDYLARFCAFRPDELSTFIRAPGWSVGASSLAAFEALYHSLPAADDLERVQRFDLATYLPDNLMPKVDRAGMLMSLEVRFPFLDHEVVDFALGLPFHYRYRSHIQKFLLKKLMRDRLPRAILYRDKMGFGIPLLAWLRGSLRGYLRETLLSRSAITRDIFAPRVIEQLLDADRPSSRDVFKLWCLLMLEEWHRHYDV
jgi:asparagine synthase (glutamine-hydrolysing)